MSSEVQLSANEMLNKKVLSKVSNDEVVRRESRDTGRVFHAPCSMMMMMMMMTS